MKAFNKFSALLLALVMTICMLVSCNEENNDIKDTDDDKHKVTVGSDVGEQAPSFSLEREGSEEKVNIKNYRGKVVVVNFWGEWCTPCKNELPHFNRVADEYQDDVVVIAIHSVQGNNKAPGYIAENFSDSNMIFAYDIPRSAGQTDMYFDLLGGSYGYPHTVVLDKNGIVTFGHTGEMSYESLKSEIDKALAK